MKKFITSVILFIAIFIAGWVIVYRCIDFRINKINNCNPSGIFIWGDSQTCQGLDYRLLEEITGRPVYSTARHGAGVYDLLVFSQRIPEHSTVVIGLSKPTLIRPKERDYNRFGLSVFALKQLYRNHYTAGEIWKIVRYNKIPIELLSSPNELYDSSAKKNLTEQAAEFSGFWEKIPAFLKDKETLFMTAIEHLLKKDCRILIVAFPSHPILNDIENRSPFRKEMIIFENKVFNLISADSLTRFVFPDKENIMYDLSHLNRKGAQILTRDLARAIRTKQGSIFIKSEVPGSDFILSQ